MKINLSQAFRKYRDAIAFYKNRRFCTACPDTFYSRIMEAFSVHPGSLHRNFREFRWPCFHSLLLRCAAGGVIAVGGLASLQAQELKAKDTLVAGEGIREVAVSWLAAKKRPGGCTQLISGDLTKKAGRQEDKPDFMPQDTVDDLFWTEKTSLRIGRSIAFLPEDRQPVLVLDGKAVSLKELRKTDPEAIVSITNLQNPDETTKYGSKGKNGVIFITTKNDKK